MKITLSEIRQDQSGFEDLASICEQTKNCSLDDIEIDMRGTNRFDADMCAMLGAILHWVGAKSNNVSLTNIQPKVKETLSMNGFLNYYGHEEISDPLERSISYKQFDVTDERLFSEYIEKEFLHRPGIPELSQGMLKKFRESIFEIFSNAVLHSRTKLGIFSCGQFFPKQKTLDFTVVDLGVGFQRNVTRYEGRKMAPEEAIDWATQGNNTTKRGSVPGGLGLKLLCEFIGLNGGRIQIVSDAGYWKQEHKETTKTALSYRFPGTAVSGEINTADRNSYVLESELTEEDIFLRRLL